RQAEALQAYRDAGRVLREELGLEPSRALRDLERAILSQDLSLEPEPAEAAGDVGESAPVAFVGRKAELVELVAGLEEALDRCRRQANQHNIQHPANPSIPEPSARSFIAMSNTITVSRSTARLEPYHRPRSLPQRRPGSKKSAASNARRGLARNEGAPLVPKG